jgi:prophage DNA circulation protein
MRNINEYLEDSIINDSVNEGLLGNLFKFFQNLFIKKYKMSNNGSKGLTDTINKNKEELDEEVKKRSTKVKVKDANDWWNRFAKSDENKGIKLIQPDVFNKKIIQNIQVAPKVFAEEIKQYTKVVNCIDNDIIQSFILRDVKDFTAMVSSINEENEKMIPKNKNYVNQVLRLFKKIESSIKDKEAKEVYDESIKTLESVL